MSALSIFMAGAGGIALGTLDAELFPTEVRSTSNAMLYVLGVLGSAIGSPARGRALRINSAGSADPSRSWASARSSSRSCIVPAAARSRRRALLDDVSPTHGDDDIDADPPDEYGPGP